MSMIFLFYLYTTVSFIFGQDLDFMPVPVSPMSETMEDGNVKQEPRCLVEPDAGTGAEEVTRYFFQSANSSCVPFLYTGEGGNSNNFLTELDCLNNCVTETKEGSPQTEEDVHLIDQDANLGKKNGCVIAGEKAEGKECDEKQDEKDEHFVAE